METLRGSLRFAVWLGLVFLLAWFGRKDKALMKCRSEAVVQFEQWQRSQQAAALHLDSGHCEIVQESETVGRARARGPIFSYTLTRFLRNSEGQYFMFKSTPTGPYVKAVAENVAKVVLKDKYVEPHAA